MEGGTEVLYVLSEDCGRDLCGIRRRSGRVADFDQRRIWTPEVEEE